MTKEIINKSELKTIRFLLQSGQKLAISTKKFERVLDKIDSLEQENKQMKSALKKIRKMVTSPYAGKPRDVLNIINEVLQ